ncbi:hypothetical protein [Saccharopolyspora griseoalba]|uniref:Uncharacterized protein n=1 Tax=Saccharopolyspora griseoalba TaxID=1431848 RepID=A0ABW2LSR6_9PSEU
MSSVKDTLKDFVGNVADDAKQAFDELLDRDGADGDSKESGLAAADSVAGAATGAAENAAAVATLPKQIAELTDTVNTLVEALQNIPGAGAVGDTASQAVQTGQKVSRAAGTRKS